jgi:membrane-associated phospholipid phosphatase
VRAVNARIKRPLAACLACVNGLVLLAALAYEAEPLGRLDAKLLSRLSAPKGSPLDRIAAAVMHLADLLPLLAMLAVVCGLALRWGRRREAIAAAVLVAGANLTAQILKVVLSHPRYQPILGYRQIGSAAFPSGHATAALSIALAFGLVVPRSWRRWVVLGGAVFALALGCSVLVLNRHYPSDVLGGWLVAGAWFFAVLIALRMGEDRSGVGALEPARKPG